MKNLNLFVLLVSVALVFSSCSNNETQLPEEQSLDLLKTYTIKRDASGAYSVDFDLNDNAKTETVIDKSINNIFLYSSDSETSRKTTQNLVIDNSELIVGFVDTSSEKSPKIIIKDTNIRLAKSSNDKLKEYSIKSNEDGTYSLDFSVFENVSVDFVFNEDIKTYEIHLEDGKEGKTNFSRILEKEEGKALKFDFVNHIINSQAKSESTTIERKPRGIII
ncbi:hypothetical protein [Polaribacter sp. L3A8]|uniref:hypothetical protein n=1 Tax=Polaribacter sp. L3A8 TaxID=2686361 RepID=UPI00131DBE72|nr:hypothetical protein [Polaribacter sp. L3A8]